MRASFVISEVLNGLRRNITMTVAMVLTTAISLALFGTGLLFVRMINKTQDFYQDKVEVTIFLTKDVSNTDKDCANDPCKSLRNDLQNNPAVLSAPYENQDQALDRYKRIFEAQPEMLKLVRPQALPASFRVKLKDPSRPEVITQTYQGRQGVDSIVDQEKLLDRFFSLFNGVRNAVFLVSMLAAVAALLLITNMIQISAFTRRTEVGIMRLVGATRWYTQLPFLLEATVAGIVGAVGALGLVIAAKAFLFDRVLVGFVGPDIIRPISGVDVLAVSPWLFLTAVLISGVTGYVTLRLYVRT